MAQSNLARLLTTALGPDAAADLLATLELESVLTSEAGAAVSRGVFAMAMNGVLFHDLMGRVPTGAAYVGDRKAAGEKVVFDHGALRTVRFADGPTGALPGGIEAFTRIFEPLGYRQAGLYPLDRLKMTGRAYAHLDHPEGVPQFFLSELHVERFSPEFQDAAGRVFGTSRDPLGAEAVAALAAFAKDGRAPMDLAEKALPQIVAAFAVTHDVPALSDYQALKAESAEAAWISTEGASFNHATDRVVDVEATAEGQRQLGRAVKDRIEISGSGRVRQTAFRADHVDRHFVDADGGQVVRKVPGSFYEFITRDIDPATGQMDLAFDTGNAQGIFKMTEASSM
ncbi:DUF1338 family protein [Caulobacter sp. 73W]|uniref:2-oxoadipate dioxygenase/decarboxylase n=1 Tax=Caulobacter sp. 73W TaxID=3161137 RepID=A0AB39KSX3_9CAUL